MIFNIFKSSPTLKELIPSGFVDIHSHILPGIDDGAKNIEESINIIYEMKDLGYSKIIATPHTYKGLYENTNQSIKKSYDYLKQKINKEIIINYSSEYLINELLNEKASSNTILTLKEKYVLVEMSFAGPPNNIFDIIFNLRLNNYIPVLAHPERYRFWFNDLKYFLKLKKMGCKFQINMFSIIGYYGRDILSFSDFLLKKNIIDFIGSDIHNIQQMKLFEKKLEIKEIKKLEKVFTSTKIFE